MTGLFTYDGPMYRDRNGIYCNTYVTNQILNRFYSVVDKVVVLIRTFEIKGKYQELHLNKLETSDRLEVVELPNINSPVNYLTRWKYRKIIETVVDRCDMYFLRIPSVISDMVAEICYKKNKPYLVEVGGCSFDAYWNHNITGRCIAPSMYLHQKKTVKNASFASYVTTKWLQSRYPTNAEFSVSASNVYLTDFNENRVRIKANQWNEHKDVYTLGTIASYETRYKGQHKIIEVLSRLKAKGIMLKYELVGGGDSSWLKGVAEKFGVSDQVVFHGLKKKEEVNAWLDTVDIYVQPSKQEGLPRSVIEAMNRGCVCLGSRKAGIPELLEEDELFAPDDVKAMCERIEMVIGEKDAERRCLRNFEKSKRYSLDILNDTRNTLFRAYKESLLH